MASAPTYVCEVLALPGSDLRSVTLRCALHNRSQRRAALLQARVYDREGALAGRSPGYAVILAAGEQQWVDLPVALPEPRCWWPHSPHCYRAMIDLHGDGGDDSVEIRFGLRTFGLRDGRFVLNGEPLFLRAALAGGWYPGTVAFPSPSLARREAEQARRLGLDALWFCGQPPTSALLAAADETGLLIVVAPDAPPPLAGGGQALAFQRALWAERFRRLARRDQNHPSLVWWRLDGVDSAGEWAARTRAALVPADDRTRLVSFDSQVDGVALPKLACLVAPPEQVASWPLQADTGDMAGTGTKLGIPVLPDLPRLVRSFGERLLPGSDAERWRRWQAALERDSQAYGLSAAFGTLEAFCRATWTLQSAAIERALETCRLDGRWAGALLGTLAGNGPVTAAGLLSPLREPQCAADALQRPLQSPGLIWRAVPAQARPGEVLAPTLQVVAEENVEGPLALRAQLQAADGAVLSEYALALSSDLFQAYTLSLGRCPQSEGRLTLAAQLCQGEQVLAETQVDCWLAGSPAPLPTGLALWDPDGALADIQQRWGVRWPAARLEGTCSSLLVAGECSEADLDAALRECRERGGRVALLLAERVDASDPAWAALLQAGCLRAEWTFFDLNAAGAANWIYSTTHPLLAGVVGVGLWDRLHASLWPGVAVRGLQAETLVGACVVNSRAEGKPAVPMLGTTLGLATCGCGQVLVCALPVARAIQQGSPAAERLLCNIAGWLAEDR